MVFKRRTYRKGKKTYRPRRKYSRRYKRTNNKVHYFKRVAITSVNITNITPFVQLTPAINEFSLNKVPGYTEYTAMFDSYKIKAIQRKYVFNKTDATVGAGYNVMPKIITVNDFNDSAILVTEAMALEYTSYKSKPLTREIKRYFKPTMSKGDGSYARPGWITTTTPTIVHYGLKSAVGYDVPEGGNGDVIGILKIYDTYYMSFKDQK